MSNKMTPIKNQLHFGSCASFAVCAALDALVKAKTGAEYPESERFLWYTSKDRKNGRGDKDECISIGEILATAQNLGNCWEESCPYDKTALVRPDAAAYTEALKMKVSGEPATGRVKISVDSFKQMLAAGVPIIIAYNIMDKADMRTATYNRQGIMRAPQTPNPDGAHGVLFVGYDDDKVDDTLASKPKGFFKFKNSWGLENKGYKVGENGYFYMPYDYVNETNINEAWVVREQAIAPHPARAGGANAVSAEAEAPGAAADDMLIVVPQLEPIEGFRIIHGKQPCDVFQY
jgi:C1A family cysteine protease